MRRMAKPTPKKKPVAEVLIPIHTRVSRADFERIDADRRAFEDSVGVPVSLAAHIKRVLIESAGEK